MTATGNVGTEHRDRAVAQRFEAKYIITELQAMAVRDFIDPYVVPDTYASVYPVTSLYLDSPALMMYRSSEMGEKNRYKLRLRVYDDDPDGPVFFEVKRRMDLVILKRRAALRREHIETVLRGGEVPVRAMYKPGDTKSYANLMYFRDLMERMSATPRVTVRYEREAYVSNTEEPVRLTFDRYLSCLDSPVYDPSIWSAESSWRYQDILPPILEIKFTDQFPFWVRQLVQRFDLMRTSMAKYCECVRSLDRSGIQVSGP